jgi:hypothetical protein
MFGIKKLFGQQPRSQDVLEQFKEDVQKTIDSLDFDDPDVRVGTSLYFVLSKQFDLIGKPEGEFPYVPPFASDKARGALMGTAIAIVRREHGETPHKSTIDAIITAFTLAFGATEGRQQALQTIEDAAAGNADINYASDWAVKDTAGAIEESSPATPAAYYLAVDGMI